MKRFTLIALAFVFVLGLAVAANADTEVKMTGDARIHANFRTNFNFTPWNARGMNYYTGQAQAATAWAPATATEETFTIWERFRLQTDFIASEALKFRFGIRVNNASWGGTLAVDNPPVAIDVNAAYLQFLIPNTEIQVSAGWMPLALPHSKIFNGGLVLDTQGGNTAAAALVIDIPVVKDTFAIKAGYTRLLSGGADFYPGGGGAGGNATTYIPDSLDAFFLAFPITIDGFQAIPWGTMAIAGRMANYTEGFSGSIAGTSAGGGNYGPYDGGLAPNLLTPASVTQFALTGQNSMWQNRSNTYWWAGLPLNITTLDPVNIYGDVIYGAGAQDDRKMSQRSGWFIDAGLEYVGFDFMKPQLMGWWSTGEHDFSQGSQRMPIVREYWSPGASFLYQTGASAFTRSTLLANPLGSWGLALSLKDITFMKDLSHTLTAAVANGTNSASYVRTVNELGLGGVYMTMGKDLTVDEWLIGLNLDTKYMIYENLSAILELGWATVSGLKGSTWGTRNVDNYGDAWKLAFGFKYTF